MARVTESANIGLECWTAEALICSASAVKCRVLEPITDDVQPKVQDTAAGIVVPAATSSTAHYALELRSLVMCPAC